MSMNNWIRAQAGSPKITSMEDWIRAQTAAPEKPAASVNGGEGTGASTSHKFGVNDFMRAAKFGILP